MKKKTYYYDINRIDLCYKLDEIIKLQKKSEEIEEKIQKIEFCQNKKNNEKEIKGNERQLKEEKDKIENKINDLIKSYKEKSSEYFCGVAFITFNTIKEQEDYMSQKKNKGLIDSAKTNMEIFFF